MKKIWMFVMVGFLFLLSLILVVVFYINKEVVACIISIIFSLALSISFFAMFFIFKSDKILYKEKLNNILKNYETILTKSATMPSLDGKNVVIVGTIEELVDAQRTFRKPIYYKTEIGCCAFFLLDSMEACIYILKVNAGVVSNLETIMEDINNNKKSYRIFSEIDKNSVIKLENSRVFKICEKDKKIVNEVVEEEEII